MIEDPRVKVFRHIIIYAVLTAGAVVMMVPLLWTLSTSLKTRDKITIRRLELIPDPVAWENYPYLFEARPIMQYTRNTMVIVVAALFGAWVPCTLAGYAFARIPFPGRNIFFWHLAGDDDAALCGAINSLILVFSMKLAGRAPLVL